MKTEKDTIEIGEARDTVKEVKRVLLETKRLVKMLLIGDEKTKNSDKWLEWKVFLYDTGLSPEDLPYDIFALARPFESVRRTRAQLQSESPGLYGPTDPEVIVKRKRSETAYRQFFANKDRWV
jgi:hypothetical protein